MKASVEHLRSGCAFSERRACRLLELPVSTFRYATRRSDDELREQLVTLARENPRFGYRRLRIHLPERGAGINPKRVFRVYQEAGLAIKRKPRKRLVRVGRSLATVTERNEEWALDFVSDAIASGRAIRVLSVVDAYTRECVALEADTSFASRRVTRVLEKAIAERGRPQRIRCDNGPELTSRHFLAWCLEHRIELMHIQPGKPTQNGRIESFNGKLRDEFLNVSWFCNLFDARMKTEVWRQQYNQQRPHSALGYLTPSAFARRSANVTSPSPFPDTAVEDRSKGSPDGSLRSALTPTLRRGSVFHQEGEVTY